MFFTALAGSLLFISCSDTPAEQQDRMNDKMENAKEAVKDMSAGAGTEFDRDRNTVADDLRGLRDNIDNKLKDANDKLAKTDLKADERTKAEAMKAELEKEKAEVDRELDKVANATVETWNDVKAEAIKTGDEVKSWWNSQKENIDKKTDADHDNDGH